MSTTTPMELTFRGSLGLTPTAWLRVLPFLATVFLRTMGWVATGTQLSDTWKAALGAVAAHIANMSFGCSGKALCFTASDLSTMASTQYADAVCKRRRGMTARH
jgi:hypothetical protein